MRWLPLLALAACSGEASDTAIWTGTINRQGLQYSFVGYDPFPGQGFQFGSSPAAMGYLDDGDSKILVSIALTFGGTRNFLDGDVLPPQTLMVQPSFEVDEEGIGIDYFEQPASTTDELEVEQLFHVEFAQREVGSMTGSFTVTATDFETFLDGRLQATVVDNDHGNASRQLDMQVHWFGAK